MMAKDAARSLLIRGGRVIDPANGIDARLDVAVAGGRIASVQANIPAAEARRVMDVSGLYVVPGLIDLHAHVFGYEGSLAPDETALAAGTTTVVDAGGSGWRTFDQFRRSNRLHGRVPDGAGVAAAAIAVRRPGCGCHVGWPMWKIVD